MKKVSYNEVRIQAEEIVNLFKSGEGLDLAARTVIRDGEDRPSNKWSIFNQLSMIVQGTEDARGYRQWEGAGRHVKKGARAIQILAPRLIKTTRDPQEDTSKEEKYRLAGFMAIPVFRVEDTEGKELPERETHPVPPLADVAERLGYDISYRGFNGRAYGWCNPGTKEIVLSTEDVPVFFHELVHCVHNSFERLQGGQHPDQEVVAEFTAAILARVYGYPWSNVAYDYIKTYAVELHLEPADACIRVLGKVDKILKFIFQEESEKKRG